MSLIQDETVRRFNRSARIVMLAELRMCAYLGLALSPSLTLTLSEQVACTQLAARQRPASRSGNRRQSTERAPSEGHSPPQAINPYGLTPTTQSQAEGACRDLRQACGVRPGVRPSSTAFCCHRGRAWPHPWCTADAPRSPARSIPVRKYYSARRRHFPLDVPEQCCGLSLSTLTREVRHMP